MFILINFIYWSINKGAIEKISFFPRKIFVTFFWFVFFTIVTGNTIYPIKVIIYVYMYCWGTNLTAITSS